MESSAFSTLQVSEELLSALKELGFENMTPIQAQTIPLLLQGHDLVGQSKTGSGKTLAFALPILEKIVKFSSDAQYGRPLQALILCPTRELCAQVAREFRRLGHKHKGLHVLILSGGMPARPQAFALERGADIVVGTPGRVLDHIERGRLDLSRLQFLVLDEADRMLDMGFQEDMALIMDEAPRTRQTVFFSATFPKEFKTMSKHYQHDPKLVTISETPEEKPKIHQSVIDVTDQEAKVDALVKLLKSIRPDSAIVFCNLKVTVAELAPLLERHGLQSAAIHGDLEQSDRDLVLAKFRNGSTRILVATDVAARGLDIQDLELVVNFDLPKQLDDYIHRIGRTARAGRTGAAVSLTTAKERMRLYDFTRDGGFELSNTVAEIADRERSGLRKEMVTLGINGGRKEKMRPGDILGALTGDAGGLKAEDVGKIEIHDHLSYVAITKAQAQKALECLRSGRIKGRKFLVRLV